MAETTDVYHIAVYSANPHDIARDMSIEGNPFYDPVVSSSVHHADEELVGGIVETWAGPELTEAQQ